MYNFPILIMSIKETSFISDLAGKLVPKYPEPIISTKVELQNFDVTINNLPSSFENFKICHISDLHNIDLFSEKPELLNKISEENPNIFIISGDSINNNLIDNSVKTISLLESVSKPQNIFITTGNHEFIRDNYQEKNKLIDFSRKLLQNNSGIIKFIRNDFREIKQGDDNIFIIGIDDPIGYKNEDGYLKNILDDLTSKIPSDKTKILISHRPEKIDLYSQYNIDLVFSGHAHGGQIEIPFIKRGLFAPNQGLFPKYTEGIQTRNKLTEIISPGLSNEFMVPRINNPGKIYFVTLHNSN